VKFLYINDRLLDLCGDHGEWAAASSVMRVSTVSVEHSKLLAAYSCIYLFKGHSYCFRDCIEEHFASKAMCVTNNS